jgi:hypothetical protein
MTVSNEEVLATAVLKLSILQTQNDSTERGANAMGESQENLFRRSV